ncbi:hypothetical protein E1295_47115, partial [Nonomuraea mesophila]
MGRLRTGVARLPGGARRFPLTTCRLTGGRPLAGVVGGGNMLTRGVWTSGIGMREVGMREVGMPGPLMRGIGTTVAGASSPLMSGVGIRGFPDGSGVLSGRASRGGVDRQDVDREQRIAWERTRPLGRRLADRAWLGRVGLRGTCGTSRVFGGGQRRVVASDDLTRDRLPRMRLGEGAARFRSLPVDQSAEVVAVPGLRMEHHGRATGVPRDVTTPAGDRRPVHAGARDGSGRGRSRSDGSAGNGSCCGGGS